MQYGRFEQAKGGTLFLDEIGDMPMDLQTRLLRVLSDGCFYRVGGRQSIRADVRVIAATNQNLEERVKEGLFREDLYHRLNVIHLQLPPLRERPEDVESLAEYFLTNAARSLQTERKKLTPEALDFIRRFPFPGNVRQLENLCNWLTVMAPAQMIHVDDLPYEFRAAAGNPALAGETLGKTGRRGDWTELLREAAMKKLEEAEPEVMNVLTRQFEAVLYRAALDFTHGRRVEAAYKLGVGRNTLTRKVQELGLSE